MTDKIKNPIIHNVTDLADDALLKKNHSPVLISLFNCAYQHIYVKLKCHTTFPFAGAPLIMIHEKYQQIKKLYNIEFILDYPKVE